MPEIEQKREFEIVQKTDDKRLVFGWASITATADGEQIVDRQQDVIEPEDLEEAVYDYVLNFRDTGEEHLETMRKKGRLVESVVLTEEKQKAMGIPPGTVPIGWWIGFKIDDEHAWERVKNGTYKMFSIEGKANREPVEKADKPTGCGVIVVRDGKILTATRKDPESNGQICGPGGHIEAGETPEQAAIREAREEFGITCKDLIPIGNQDGGEKHGKSAIFVCSDFEGEPKTDEEEMTNLEWQELDTIREANTFPPFKESLEMLIDAINAEKDEPEEKEMDIEEIVEVNKFNPYHDGRGRFSSSNGFKTFSANANTADGARAIARHSRTSDNSRIANVHRTANQQRVIDQWKQSSDFQKYQSELQAKANSCTKLTKRQGDALMRTAAQQISRTDRNNLTPHFKRPRKLPNGDNNTSGYFQSKNSFRLNQKIRDNVKAGKKWDDGFDADDRKTLAAMEKNMQPLNQGLTLRRNVSAGAVAGLGISAADIKAAASDPKKLSEISQKLMGEWGTNEGYTSTGYDFTNTSSFSNREVSIVIHAPKGTNAFISPTQQESEIVLARNTKLRYTGKVKVTPAGIEIEAVVD